MPIHSADVRICASFSVCVRWGMGMTTKLVASVALIVGGLSLAAPAMAFDHKGQAACNSAECYEKVRQPDVYGTAQRPVMLQPGHTEVNHLPAAIQLRTQRIEVVPGMWHAERSPALYGSTQKHVLVKPAHVSLSHTPAVYKTMHEQVMSGGHVRWERVRDAHGHERLCKVVTPGRMMSMARRVMVSPAHTSQTVVPATYRTVTRAVLVKPAKTHYTYQNPVHQFVGNVNVIRPATVETTRHDPVWGTESETVLVKKGGYAWQPARY
jgi:hypothetical protein